MFTNSKGKKLWIADEAGSYVEVKKPADIHKRPRGHGLPDWWVVEQTPDWRPPRGKAGTWGGGSLLSMGLVADVDDPDDLDVPGGLGGAGAAAPGAGGLKIGAGGKPQGYDSNGRYTGPRGGSVSLLDGSISTFETDGRMSINGEEAEEADGDKAPREDADGPQMTDILLAGGGRVVSDAGRRVATPKDYSPVPDHDDGGAAFYKALRYRESSDNTETKAPTGSQYVGLYQLGAYERRQVGAQDAQGNWTGKYGTSEAEFLAARDLQERAAREWHGKLWQEIRQKRLDQYVGRTVGGVEVTPSGMIAAAHLKGVDSGLKPYLESGGKDVRKDGRQTTVKEYLEKLGGYPVPFK